MCPHCRLSAEDIVVTTPVGADFQRLWEAWYCMECETRMVVTTLMHKDQVEATDWDLDGPAPPLFNQLPPPWIPEDDDEEATG